MKLFRVSYRWLSSYWWENITGILYDLKNGSINVVRWIPVIWFDRDWDWEFLNRILIYKFERMAKAMDEGHLLHAPDRAGQLRICALLCKRMSEDNYNRPEQSRADQRLLGAMIGKHYQSWWD